MILAIRLEDCLIEIKNKEDVLCQNHGNYLMNKKGGSGETERDWSRV